MTPVDSVAGPRTAVSRRLAPLIGREVRRLARHPVLWLVPVIVVVTTGVETASAGRTAGCWYRTIFTAVAFFGPLIVLFAANLVASSARRSRAEEMLNVTPTTDTRRTWAMSLGVALPLAGAGAIGAGAMALIDSVNDIAPEDLLTAGELAQLPFVLAGAGLLGVLAARWLPFAGGALITFVAAILGGVNLFSRFDSGIWWMWWTTETTFEGRGPVPGEPWLHVAYLFLLCTCATVAAVYRDRTQWTRLALVGVPVVAATLACTGVTIPDSSGPRWARCPRRGSSAASRASSPPPPRTRGAWLRMKMCKNPSCYAGFFDKTRNSSGLYCSNACSSQASQRAYRSRLKGACAES